MALLRKRTWVLTILFLAAYTFFAGSNVAHRYSLMEQSLNRWQFLFTLFSGPPVEANVVALLQWVSIPGAFLLTVGAPFSHQRRAWQRLVLVRSGHRRSFWSSVIGAYLITAFIFIFLATMIGGMVATLILPGTWQMPVMSAAGWTFFNLMTTIVWYAMLTLTLSLFVNRSGTATILTIIIGYVLTALAVHITPLVPYFRPILGAVVNAGPASTGRLAAEALDVTLVFLLWVLAGMFVSFRNVRNKHF